MSAGRPPASRRVYCEVRSISPRAAASKARVDGRYHAATTKPGNLGESQCRASWTTSASPWTPRAGRRDTATPAYSTGHVAVLVGAPAPAGATAGERPR